MVANEKRTQRAPAGDCGASFKPYPADMPYTARRTWPDTEREDYIIKCEGLDVGRVYRTRLPDGDRFVWSVYMNGHVPQVDGAPISGATETLDEAGAQFKRSYERMRTKAGLPKPQR